jgi:Pentapeptide repeats (8 copies)
MADQAHLEILRQGVQGVRVWNSWRERNPWPTIVPDLSRADLTWANLTGADLFGANLFGAELSWANLSGADLSKAALTYCALVETNLTGATFTSCRIYGISAWNLKLEGAIQQNLNISNWIREEHAVTVDNLEVAQFIYLLLSNERIRQVIDTITSKVVLILGRFTPERKAVLDAIRDSLRQRDYLPVLFDFDKPAGRDLTETISTLAHMARFIIADITEAKSIPGELQAIVPDLPSVPVQPLLLTSEREYGMFEHIRRYPLVLDTYYYDNLDDVLASVEDKVISPAETKARELAR